MDKSRALLLAIALATLLFMPFSSAQVFCNDGETRECGSDVGACQKGVTKCVGGVWQNCEGEIKPAKEVCGNGIDEDCDGIADNNCGDTTLETLSYILIVSGAILFIFAMVVARIQSRREKSEEEDYEEDEP